MRSLVTCLGLLISASAAFAADMPIKASAPIVQPANYSGFYFGLVGAGAKTAGDFALLDIPGTGNLRPSGLMAGGLVGAGTWAGNLYLGVEADFSFDFSKAHSMCAFATDCSLKSGWFLTQRIVIGAQMSSISGAARRVAPASLTQWRDNLQMPATLSAGLFMPYLTGGLAERRIEACISQTVVALPAEAILSTSGCGHQWLIGPAVGGGLAIPVAAGWSFTPEYLYVRWNKHFQPGGQNQIFPTDFKAVSEHAARLKLTGHF